MRGSDELNAITQRVIGACIEVHRRVGPGLFESTYEECLVDELRFRGMQFERQVLLPLCYRDRELAQAYRLDLVVEGVVIVEVKAVVALEPIHQAQILTYLRLSGLPAGLLVNFHSPTLRAGLRRYLNDRPPTSSRGSA